MRRHLLLLLVPLLTALALPAGAAGTGGIEVTPVPSQRDGKPVTVFRVELPSDGSVRVPYTVRNVEDGPRQARVYAARVTRDGDAFSLDDPGSSPYVEMPDRTVELAAGELLEETFEVRAPRGDRPADQQYAAVVVEVRNGAVVQRASTLVYLSAGRSVPLPLLVVLVAVGVLTTAAAAVAVTVRRRRS